MQKTTSMDEEESINDDLGIVNNSVSFKNDLALVTEEELSMHKFLATEEEAGAIVNILDNTEERDSSTELYFPDISSKNEMMDENLKGYVHPADIVVQEEGQVSEMLNSENVQPERTPTPE